jgi:flagellar secretion chaperone FliS
MNATTAIKTYASVGLESGVSASDPHKLILMLYQGALLAIVSAKNQILRKETAAKGASITKAIAIIDEGLKACLDKNAGGELAQNLSALYDYINQRLLVANLKNDVVALDEVSRLLAELKGAWEAIRPIAAPSVQQDDDAAAVRQLTAPLARQAALTYGRI